MTKSSQEGSFCKCLAFSAFFCQFMVGISQDFYEDFILLEYEIKNLVKEQVHYPERISPHCTLYDDAIHKQYITHRVSQWSLFTNVPGMDPGCSLMQSCLLFKGHLLSIWDYISSQDAKQNTFLLLYIYIRGLQMEDFVFQSGLNLANFQDQVYYQFLYHNL